MQKNTNGTWCYLPAANSVRAVACAGAASNFATVMNVHLNQGLSIAYYNGVDNVLLGGANYSLPVGANMPIIRLCMSGRAGDGLYDETLCVNALSDNLVYNTPYCQVTLAQKEVTDGCYEPLSKLYKAPSSVSDSGAAICTGGVYGTTRTSKSVIPAKFSIARSGVFVAVVVVRTLLQL